MSRTVDRNLFLEIVKACNDSSDSYLGLLPAALTDEIPLMITAYDCRCGYQRVDLFAGDPKGSSFTKAVVCPVCMSGGVCYAESPYATTS